MTFAELPDIGGKIRAIRQQRGLTLDEVAKLTSVSKAMLGQIERSESTPTISVLWKISGGLRISMSDLLANEAEELVATNIEKDIDPVFEAEGKTTLYNVFPFSPSSGFEYFYIKMQPGAKYTSEAHENVVEEYVVVTQGKIEITFSEHTCTLEAPAALRFPPKQEHSYANPYDQEAIFQNIIKY